MVLAFRGDRGSCVPWRPGTVFTERPRTVAVFSVYSDAAALGVTLLLVVGQWTLAVDPTTVARVDRGVPDWFESHRWAVIGTNTPLLGTSAWYGVAVLS